LFNPGFEIQNTDNYIDWTSLSVALLTEVVYSSRAVPVGTEEPIDIATLTFDLPIWLTLPAKVKKMGVVTQMVANIFSSDGTIDLDTVFSEGRPIANLRYTPMDYRVLLVGNTLTLMNVDDVDVNNEVLGTKAFWRDYVGTFGTLTNGVSQVRLEFPFPDSNGTYEIVGSVAYNPNDPSQLLFEPFANTLPANTLPPVNAIIDPFNVSLDNNSIPIITPPTGTSYLIVNPIGDPDSPSAVAWAGAEGTNLVAHANDIITWNGSYWTVTFDSRNTPSVQYVTNLNTTIQYIWNAYSWTKSIEGIYQAGEWSLIL
jgi:hypothetical protein